MFWCKHWIVSFLVMVGVIAGIDFRGIIKKRSTKLHETTPKKTDPEFSKLKFSGSSASLHLGRLRVTAMTNEN